MCRNLVTILLQEFIPTCPDSSLSQFCCRSSFPPVRTPLCHNFYYRSSSPPDRTPLLSQFCCRSSSPPVRTPLLSQFCCRSSSPPSGLLFVTVLLQEFIPTCPDSSFVTILLQEFIPTCQDYSFVTILLQEFIPTCPDSSFSYIIPSPVQCDLYYLCEFGTASRRFVSRFLQELIISSGPLNGVTGYFLKKWTESKFGLLEWIRSEFEFYTVPVAESKPGL
jgi:hypothetical protein